jgi:predicted GNAT family acetyltransferase
MPWSVSQDAGEFVSEAGPFLRTQPARHTLELTIIDTLRTRGPVAFGPDPPLFGWWRPPDDPDGPVAAAFLHTPPYPLVLSSAPDRAAAALADTLATAGRELPGVDAGEAAAGRFAARWCQRTGATTSVHMRTRLYRLDGLVPLQPAPGGHARVVAATDRDLLVTWFGAFLREAGMIIQEDPERLFDDRAGRGTLMIWEDGGQPVSMAGATQQVAGMCRVGPVYTPPALRGRGYAGAVTAAVSQAALEAGAAEVLLFTDLANPASNGLYQRLGYRPVEDRAVLSFAA